MRRAPGLPSLRSERLHNLLREAIRQTRREGFRIIHYSVQADHVHLVIEAHDGTILTNGMRSFAVRVAMRVNGQIFRRRAGRVWGDRYHTEELSSPQEVRNTLVYVLKNHAKHGHHDVGPVDPLSSGPWWDGWMQVFDPPPEPSVVEAPTTWLLRRGWRGKSGFGYIHLGELPGAARAPRPPPPRR
jgi:REP element-mobilizing transposase RayT